MRILSRVLFLLASNWRQLRYSHKRVGVSKSKNAADGNNDLDLQGVILKRRGELKRSEKML